MMFHVCTLDELKQKHSIGFSEQSEGKQVEGFVVYDRGQVYAYHNHCPHTGANLNWMPDQFLTVDNTFIQCSIHGALFKLDDGLCVRGPCQGQSLSKIICIMEDSQIYVKLR